MMDEPDLTSLPLARRDGRPDSQVEVGDCTFGSGPPVIIAGPCSVEGPEAILEAARAVRGAGAHMLRGGAFKPRTSPYSFQGHGRDGLLYLRRAGQNTGLPVVTEVMEPGLVDLVAAEADMLQIGARSMQNFPLLKAAGRSSRPVLLKRGPTATVREWLASAEYVLRQGNERVVLCERGIRTFVSSTRYTLDLSTAALVQRLTHLPVIVDPSHGTGRSELVPTLAAAALTAGVDGLLVECHPRPAEALSDGRQTITPQALKRLCRQATALVAALSRETAARSG